MISIKRISLFIIGLVPAGTSALIIGTYYRTPNLKLLSQVIRAEEKWKADAFITITRSTDPLLSFEHFDFNWGLATITFLLVYSAFLFLFDYRTNKKPI
jgi:hypothetical protein